ncbi:T9SS type A sorting domain-containing protein [Leptobacterium sp. I13]|uniref:T9SS type A sorting domain-containing protein n=1 Tax=Leptobacterium meishanense TaxID=3128904 RepID=UPI0030ECD698
MQIDNSLINGIPLNIRAETNPTTVGSVFLTLSGTTNASRTESVAPYALFGDVSGNYNGQSLVTGNYAITATPYSSSGATEEAGIPLNINFEIIQQPIGTQDEVTQFVLVNANTNTDILTLSEGLQIDNSLINGIPLNIRAETNPTTVGSVFLTLSGTTNASRTESVAPYALFGDVSGNYNGQSLVTGNYAITATPYSSSGATGEAGTPLNINFEIIDTAVGNKIIITPTKRMIPDYNSPILKNNFYIFPNPIKNGTFSINLPNVEGKIHCTLYSSLGILIINRTLIKKKENPYIHFNLSNALIESGTYYLKMEGGNLNNPIIFTLVYK